MKTEPKIGERVAWNNVRYRCYEDKLMSCCYCDLNASEACHLVACNKMNRRDNKHVFFIREGHYTRKQLSEILKARRPR